MTKTKKIIIIVYLVVFLFGLCLFFYPEYLIYRFRKGVERKKNEFSEICTDTSEPSNDSAEETDIPRIYPELYEAMQKYNIELYESGQNRLVDEYSYEKPELLLSDYGIDNGEVLGFIEIPEVEIELPVLNGATYENMMNGAVYLANTSLPIGSENSNCVIAAHNQWKGVYMFMKITELEKGDKIYITNLWETLEYDVSSTKIIEPDDSNEIFIKDGKNMVTLSTCFYTPSGKKRFLVFAEKV